MGRTNVIISMRCLCAALAVAGPCCFCAGTPPQAAVPVYRVTGSIGSLAGRTTYQIGGAIAYGDGRSGRFHFPISELEFPLDVQLLQVHAAIERLGMWALEANVGASLTSDAGIMEDSDWITPGILGVYSRSDAVLDAVLLDVRADRAFRRWGAIEVRLAGGVHGSQYDFDVQNTGQVSLLDGSRAAVSGTTLTYAVAQIIPYVGLRCRYAPPGPVACDAMLGFAPFMVAWDEDVHLARNPQKYSEGTYDGHAFLGSLRGRYTFSGEWFLQAAADYVAVDASGDQDVRAGAETWQIDARLDSVYGAIHVGIGRHW